MCGKTGHNKQTCQKPDVHFLFTNNFKKLEDQFGALSREKQKSLALASGTSDLL